MPKYEPDTKHEAVMWGRTDADTHSRYSPDPRGDMRAYREGYACGIRAQIDRDMDRDEHHG